VKNDDFSAIAVKNDDSTNRSTNTRDSMVDYDETTRLGRERGWTHWHHMFTPRDLVVLSVMKRELLDPGL
jgi:hypothetical protein